MKRLIVRLALLVHAGVGQLEAETIWTWNWDSGTTEGWVGYAGKTDLTIESGRNGTTALGFSRTTGGQPTIVLEGHNIDPGSPVGGNFGNYVPMTYDMYVDVNKEEVDEHNYLDLYIDGESSFARFHTYPDNDTNPTGSTEALGDGWYRHHLENRWHHEYTPGYQYPVGTITLRYPPAAVFDNLTIHGEDAQPIPGPSSLVVCSLAAATAGVGAWRRRRKRKAN